MFFKKKKKEEYVELRGILGNGKDYHVYHMTKADFLAAGVFTDGLGRGGLWFEWPAPVWLGAGVGAADTLGLGRGGIVLGAGQTVFAARECGREH